ncbi:MAG: ABC transporter ATP-binding protein [Frateuria sp.]|uniref:ABC transporter ATP-binding protein n=1 Tax=Frateuria sp. TaxID=2211372 RepID=UPI001795008C|nr:ABC transporter ATP-binding protein [Frateuria sp.]NUO72872.1 ABC transporter ATP-binding protein [Frateuria sp.]NUR22130.1 ABC transporter ATP-binding protein [Frateuria sp.]
MPEAEQVDPEGAAEAPHTGVLAELGQLGQAIKQLFGAQLELLSAELGLARSAISWMLLAGLAATIAGVGLGLTLLALVGVLLAKWFASWVWALMALAVLQLVFMLAAIVFFRRCMHWMSLPATRNEWSAMMRQTRARARRQVDGEDAA